jgi:hypothetical protein
MAPTRCFPYMDWWVDMSVTLIATATSTSSFSTFDFQSISGSYTDLMLVISANSTSTLGSYNRMNLAFNGGPLSSQSNTICSRGFLENPGNVPNSDPITDGNIGWIPATSNASQFSTFTLYITNYAGTSGTRGWIARNANGINGTTNGSAAFGLASAVINASTAITRITIGDASGANLRGHSVASLYGITKGGSGSVTPA